MSVTCGYPSFYSWQYIPLYRLFARPLSFVCLLLYLLDIVWYKPLNASLIAVAQWYRSVIKAPGSLWFFAAQMAFTNLGPHNFTAASDMEAATCPFVSLDFWHLGLAPLVLFS
jgi:hypothetical protein